MSAEFSISRLGEAQNNSPLDSAVFIDDSEGVLVDSTLSGFIKGGQSPSYFEKAGPRQKLFFNPRHSIAAIVTCGGLCPGLNDVIRGLVMVLWYRYGVRNILGLPYGFEGLVKKYKHHPIRLTPDIVEDIHQDGGTILASSRGAQDFSEMADFLQEQKIDMLFTIGGDGTQKGALSLAEEMHLRRLPVSIVGIPKTIDNDVMYTERTFGFQTAVAMSREPITCAHMEAKGARHGVGMVKLMGRECGLLAAHAAIASSDVNLLLVPECPFSLEWLFDFLKDRLVQKNHAVVVVAEGAGQDLVNVGGEDASGNKKLGDIGVFLKDAITEHFEKEGFPMSLKYIDPSYIIRSAPANAIDSVFCFQLAGHAVHAAMSGRTEVLVGLWNGRFVHIPTRLAVQSRKQIDTSSLFWQSVLDNTGQPRELA